MDALEFDTQEIKREIRHSKPFRTKGERRRYFITLFIALALSIGFGCALIFYNNPVPVDSASFIPVTQRRFNAVIAMIIAAICHSLATVSFQTIANNRIIAPSLLGFEALYSAINTSVVFFFGLAGHAAFTGIKSFGIQIVIMIVVSLLLYGTLLTGKRANMQRMLLVGIVLGMGLQSIASFMRRLLTPSEFDILQARLFGSVNNADPEFFPIAIPLVLIAALLLLLRSKHLNLIVLGKECCLNLGINMTRETLYLLTLITILMAVSTALIGPLTFLGFLVACLSYIAVPSYDHKYILPMSIVLGFLVLSASYFMMYHVFNVQGVVSIIIELFGGLAFIIIILRRGKL